jgi:hypothetical protein
MKSQIQRQHPTLTIVEIDIPSMGTSVATLNQPRDLDRYIAWYPTLFLLSQRDWEAAQRGGKINAKIFNGQMRDQTPQYVNAGYPLTADGISRWIRDSS